jgi:hypothetical protein
MKPIFRIQYIFSVSLTVCQIDKLMLSLIPGGNKREKAPEHYSALVVRNLCAARSRRQE